MFHRRTLKKKNPTWIYLSIHPSNHPSIHL